MFDFFGKKANPVRLSMLVAGIIALTAIHFPVDGIAANDDVRAAFNSRAFLDSCVSQQRAEAQNNGVPDEMLVRYCVCTGDNLTKTITAEELKAVGNTPYANFPAELRVKIYTAGMSCLQEMRSKCVRDSVSHVTCKQ